MTFRPYTKISSSSVSDDRSNNTGSVITKSTPVKINNFGELDFINVSIESDVKGSIGVASEDIADGSKGFVATSGKIEDITIAASFGDPVYISKTGTLTNLEPETGVGGFVSGDFVVAMGIIAKNESNPLLKDLIISVEIRGQLA